MLWLQATDDLVSRGPGQLPAFSASVLALEAYCRAHPQTRIIEPLAMLEQVRKQPCARQPVQEVSKRCHAAAISCFHSAPDHPPASPEALTDGDKVCLHDAASLPTAGFWLRMCANQRCCLCLRHQQASGKCCVSLLQQVLDRRAMSALFDRVAAAACQAGLNLHSLPCLQVTAAALCEAVQSGQVVAASLQASSRCCHAVLQQVQGQHAPLISLSGVLLHAAVLTAPSSLQLTSLPPPDELLGRLSAAGISLPAIFKSAVACGVAEAHKMAIALRPEGLSEVDVPMPACVQPFVDHGAVIHKIYAAGGQVCLPLH